MMTKRQKILLQYQMDNVITSESDPSSDELSDEEKRAKIFSNGDNLSKIF